MLKIILNNACLLTVVVVLIFPGVFADCYLITISSLDVKLYNFSFGKTGLLLFLKIKLYAAGEIQFRW